MTDNKKTLKKRAPLINAVHLKWTALPQSGRFNCYGLSVNPNNGEKLASIPHF